MNDKLFRMWIATVKVTGLLLAFAAFCTYLDFVGNSHDAMITTLYTTICFGGIFVIVGITGFLVFYKPLALLRNISSALTGSAHNARREGHVLPFHRPRPTNDSTDHRRSA